MKIIKKCDGIVIIENFLSIAQQKKIVDSLINPMIDEGLLHDTDGNPNCTKTRGRHYCNLNDFEENVKNFLINICKNVINNVRSVDKTIPESNVTHLLTLCYETTRGMGFHRDDGSNDGDADSPVISFTIGNSCVFDYKLEGTKHSVQLNSGDVIIFGGPQRFMWHSVKKVIRKTCPEQLNLGNVRINLTFRQATSVIGKEGKYSTENYKKRLYGRYNKINSKK